MNRLEQRFNGCKRLCENQSHLCHLPAGQGISVFHFSHMMYYVDHIDHHFKQIFSKSSSDKKQRKK